MPLEGSGFIPEAVIGAMSVDDARDSVDAGMRLARHHEMFNRHLAEVSVCGSERVITAGEAMKADFGLIYEGFRRGEFRTFRPSVRRELVNAFRIDLGYPELDEIDPRTE